MKAACVEGSYRVLCRIIMHFLACERQKFLLAHQRWGTFREEERRLIFRRIPHIKSLQQLCP